jgi:hypothetical protein
MDDLPEQLEKLRNLSIIWDDEEPSETTKNDPVRLTIQADDSGWIVGYQIMDYEPFWAYVFRNYRQIDLRASGETIPLAVDALRKILAECDHELRIK